MTDDKPKLLFKTQTRRGPFFWRATWMLLGTVAACGAWAALNEAARRDSADPMILEIGVWLAVLVVVLLFLRLLLNLWRGLTTKNEQIAVFDRGFTWVRSKKQHKYRWEQLQSFRRGAREVRLFGQVILRRGAHTLTMQDGQVFKFTARHGDTRRFARSISPIIADITGTRMGRALRAGKSIRLHPELVIAPAGIAAGGAKIPWSQADLKVKNERLTIYRLGNGRPQEIQRYNTSEIDNLAGFLDVADSTIRNHQPKRFKIKTQGLYVS